MCLAARHLQGRVLPQKINLGCQEKFLSNQNENPSSRIIVLRRERLPECSTLFAYCFGCGIEFDKVAVGARLKDSSIGLLMICNSACISSFLTGTQLSRSSSNVLVTDKVNIHTS